MTKNYVFEPDKKRVTLFGVSYVMKHDTKKATRNKVGDGSGDDSDNCDKTVGISSQILLGTGSNIVEKVVQKISKTGRKIAYLYMKPEVFADLLFCNRIKDVGEFGEDFIFGTTWIGKNEFQVKIDMEVPTNNYAVVACDAYGEELL